MGGSGYRPSREAVAALYGAVSGPAQMREESPEHFGTVRQWEILGIYMSSISLRIIPARS